MSFPPQIFNSKKQLYDEICRAQDLIKQLDPSRLLQDSITLQSAASSKDSTDQNQKSMRRKSIVMLLEPTAPSFAPNAQDAAQDMLEQILDVEEESKTEPGSLMVNRQNRQNRQASATKGRRSSIAMFDTMNRNSFDSVLLPTNEKANLVSKVFNLKRKKKCFSLNMIKV